FIMSPPLGFIPQSEKVSPADGVIICAQPGIPFSNPLLEFALIEQAQGILRNRTAHIKRLIKSIRGLAPHLPSKPISGTDINPVRIVIKDAEPQSFFVVFVVFVIIGKVGTVPGLMESGFWRKLQIVIPVVKDLRFLCQSF